MKLLTSHHLSHSFGTRLILDDINLSVERGDFLALLGPSGAGKTTLIRLLAGLLKPSQGQTLVNGQLVSTKWGSHRRDVAVIFQQFNLIGRLNALDNVLAGRLGHVPSWRGILRKFTSSDRLLALQCLERVGLLDLALQRADTLSGGQQQRVAIARALAQQSKIILADEPIASLDPQSSAEILKLLQQISSEGQVAIICSLHQLEFARGYASRIVGMQAGKVLVDVGADQFDDRAANFVYGGSQDQQ